MKVTYINKLFLIVKGSEYFSKARYIVPVKGLDKPTHSRVRIIVKTSTYEITHMESCSNTKSVKQIKIYFIFEILQSTDPLP
jgi:hypothetical protein